MTRVSIALCVCHGARFLDEQLSSLRAQSRVPNEVVIGDDASEDESVAIVERFSAEAPFPVRLIRNSPRLGVRRNFEKVISHCTNELIALCDQDDVWLPEKLDVLASRLEDEASAMAAFSDATVVDENLNPLGYTMWQRIGFSGKRRKQMTQDCPWQPLFKDPVVTGATLIFRKQLVDACLPIPDSWVHDAWIAQLAAAHGKILPVDEPLILYRQHSSNVIGGKRLSLRAQLREANFVGRLGVVERELSRYRQLLERLSDLDITPRQTAMREAACAKVRHLQIRQKLPAERVRRLPMIVSEWLNGNYIRYSKDWRNIAADLLMP